MQYGYRMFAVALHEGRKRTVLPITAAQRQKKRKSDSDQPIEDFRDTAHRDVLFLKGKTQTFGVSEEDISKADLTEATAASMRFINATRTNAALRLWLVHGLTTKEGLSINPVGDDSDDFPLAGRPTVLTYRATLLADEDHPIGLLAVETRGLSCPIASIVRGLHGANLQRLVAEAGEDADKIAEARRAWRLKPLQNVSDYATVKRFIETGDPKSATLEKWGYDRDGNRSRNPVNMAVVINEISQERVRRRALGWLAGYFGRNEVNSKDQANAMKPEVLTATVDIDFDDVAVEIESGIQKKTFRPNSDLRRFTYVTSDKALTDAQFFAAAEADARPLLSAVQQTADSSGGGE